MRRALVPLVLVGSILLVQSPAHAYHRFYRISLASKGDTLLMSVVTDCENGKKLTISSPSLRHSVTRTVPRRTFLPSGRRAGTSRMTITTKLVGGSSAAKFTATCADHPLCPSAIKPCPERLKSQSAAMTLEVPDSLLPWTGTSTLPWLTLGLCLVLMGSLLLALGRRTKEQRV
jgi:hypothetical protein